MFLSRHVCAQRPYERPQRGRRTKPRVGRVCEAYPGYSPKQIPPFRARRGERSEYIGHAASNFDNTNLVIPCRRRPLFGSRIVAVDMHIPPGMLDRQQIRISMHLVPQRLVVGRSPLLRRRFGMRRTRWFAAARNQPHISSGGSQFDEICGIPPVRLVKFLQRRNCRCGRLIRRPAGSKA